MVGLAVAPAVGLSTVSTFVFAATVAGWALAPDLDAPGATASRLLGPITGALSWALRGASRAVYAATKGPRDRDCLGEHRHLTHTVLAALVAGGFTALGTAVGGRAATLVVLLFGVFLAQAALGDWILVVAGVGGLALLLHGFTAAVDGIRPWLWIAVTLGCLAHIVCDGATKSGVPAVWPIRIRNQSWYCVGSPRTLRFRTGSEVETRFVFPTFAVLGVLLVPGVWTTLLAILNH